MFVTQALLRLSVALCNGNAYVHRVAPQSFAGNTGRAVVRTRAWPGATSERVCEWIPRTGTMPGLYPL